MPRVVASLLVGALVGWAGLAASLLSVVAAPVPPSRPFRPRPPLPGAYVALWSGSEWPTVLLEGGGYVAERPGLRYEGSGKVPPAQTFHNYLNGAPGDRELRSQGGLCDVALGIPGTNLSNLTFGQFACSLLFSPRLPVLRDHVNHVVLVRSNKEMLWPNACPVVAPVKDEEARRNAAMGKEPCHAVCRMSLAVVIHDSVASTGKFAKPKPAPIRLPHLGPKGSSSALALVSPPALRVAILPGWGKALTGAEDQLLTAAATGSRKISSLRVRHGAASSGQYCVQDDRAFARPVIRIIGRWWA